MAAKLRKPPVDEEAHFRIDENERSIDGLRKSASPEAIVGTVNGAIASLMQKIAEDVKADKEVIERLEEFIRSQVDRDKKIEQLITVITELIVVLTKPATRTGGMETKEGPVKVTVTEKR